MPSALIVDDQPYIRAAVQDILVKEGYEVVAQAGDGVQALALARQLRPALIVMEIAIPRLDGIDVIQRIKRLGFPTYILVLTSYAPEYSAERCLKAGAAGFITKNHSADDFRDALHTVSNGFIFFPNLQPNDDGPRFGDAAEKERLARLSNRELAVLRYLAVGFNNLQIGEALLLSNKTVSSYKSRLVAKLRVKSVVCLAELARRHNLV